MKIVQRTPGDRHQCDLGDCTRSARFDLILLDGRDSTPVCHDCMESMRLIYDRALSNWADEFKDAA